MRKGVLSGIGAYLIWGVMPIWLKQIQMVPAMQILAHRIAWSFIFLLIIILIRHQIPHVIESIKSRKILLIYSTSALLLTINWLTYIFAVNSDHIVESSLGYFINPLVNVLIGVFIFRERLRRMQWLPIGIAALGVSYLTLAYGHIPWIAFVLAFSFAMYAVVKKAAPLGPLRGLTIETALLFSPAIILLFVSDMQGVGAFGHHSVLESLLLLFAGVITAIPLLLFGLAARTIPLTMVGLLQYIAPTCQFLIGIFVYHEPFTRSRLIGFVIIWIALAIFWIENYISTRRKLPKIATVPLT